MVGCDSCAFNYVCSVRKHVFHLRRNSTWPSGQERYIYIQMGGRETRSRGWNCDVGGRGTSGCFTFRSVLDGNLFRDTYVYSHSELPLTSCLGLLLGLLNSLFINRSLFKPRFSRKRFRERNEYPLGTCGKNISRFPYPRLEAIYTSPLLFDSPFTIYGCLLQYLLYRQLRR